MKLILPATFILLCLAACSPEPAAAPDGAADQSMPSAAAPPPDSPPSAPVDSAPRAEILTLEGLGALRIGQEVPTGSGWVERGAQISDGCHTIGSLAHPGVYAIVEEGRVSRISVGQGSTVRLVEGIGAGSTEKEARAAFPGFREAPHKYSDPPAKYLTAPNAESGDPALRFEIGSDGKVSLIHVGTRPALFYVEGCA